MKDKKEIILQCIQTYLDEHQITPSIRDICAETGIKSPSTVHRYLHVLKNEGKIQLSEGKNRSIVLMATQNVRKIPVLKCFQPNLFTAGNIDHFITAMIPFKQTQKLFAVIVKEDDETYCFQKGDIIIAEKTDDIREGGIAVAAGKNHEFCFCMDSAENTYRIGTVLSMIRIYQDN